MSLESLTQAAKQNADRTEFAREMMAGNLSEDKYKTFLWNAYLVYDILEDVAASMGAFAPMDPSMPADDLPLDGLQQADDILGLQKSRREKYTTRQAEADSSLIC